PGPILHWREGETVTLSVTNRLPQEASIHWHGIRSPAGMDGVPGLSFRGIAPGETFVYRFPVRQNGTYWYHSHSRFQEQTGVYGSLIIEPRDKDPIEYDCDYVVLLSDWTDENPDTVYGNLRKQSAYYNYHERTVGTFVSDVKKKGLRATISDRLAWGRTNMSPTDIADVSSATYTYLLNGKAPSANWTALFEPGQRVRLRFINGSAMTIFDVRVPGLEMTVVQADGNAVQPVNVDEFRIGVAETYDVVVQPRTDSAYTIFAQAEDRGGYSRGTLAPKMGMTAEVPPMDPRPIRTMGRMNMKGMAMGGTAMGGMAGHDVAAMKSMNMHDMSAMPNMHSTPPRDETLGKEPFPQPGPNTARLMPTADVPDVPPEAATAAMKPMHVGPELVMPAMRGTAQLDKPGDGLNGNGRRVLTYSDLRALYPGVDGRPPSRSIELHLTGNMERFIWGFDAYKFSQAEPIYLKLGERVRFVLINDTMMEHPIHLHGLWSELENEHGEFAPYKHSIIVKPGERVSYLVSADTPGRWAYHCHLLYHMAAGMFRTVIVS
ncbi:MAG TPA: copper resistance system multicopper oxidase, partial [Bryobacteraceae bacterium]|nr:copper resistance system multicopper oxidase [Bryobacteraceae bacterium]